MQTEKIIGLFVAALAVVAGMGSPPDRLTYIVSGANLKWTVPGDRLRSMESGEYVPRNVVPTRMAMRNDGTVYLTMPRLFHGVPFTLGAIEYDPCSSTIEPPISPYPCGGAHRSHSIINNWTLVNVVDIFMDDGGVLWALDVGKVNTLDDTVVVRQPMVFAIDTENNKILRAIDLSRTTSTHSCLQSITVSCGVDGGQFVYVADAGLGNVIVYNVAADRSFKVRVPVGSCGHRDIMYIGLTKADATDAAIGCGGGCSFRQPRLYTTYLSSCNMVYVPVHMMDNSTSALTTVDVGRKPCKMVMLGTDLESIIYFRNSDSTDIRSWNVNRPMIPENFKLVYRGKTSRIPLMVIIGYQGFHWFMESNYVDLLVGDIGSLGVSTKIDQLRCNKENAMTTTERLIGGGNFCECSRNMMSYGRRKIKPETSLVRAKTLKTRMIGQEYGEIKKPSKAKLVEINATIKNVPNAKN